MALQSSGTISHTQIRNEFHQGFTTAPLNPASVTNSSIANFRGIYNRSDHWNSTIPSSGAISYSDFYGKSGRTGRFVPGRVGNSPEYLYGWRSGTTGEAGTFVDPEQGDTAGVAMGSNVLGGQQERCAPYFYVTQITVEFSRPFGSTIGNTFKVGIWGKYNSTYTNTYAIPPTIEFKIPGSNIYTGYTLSSPSSGAHSDPSTPTWGHNYETQYRVTPNSDLRYYAYRDGNTPSGPARSTFDLMAYAYANNQIVAWRTY